MEKTDRKTETRVEKWNLVPDWFACHEQSISIEKYAPSLTGVWKEEVSKKKRLICRFQFNLVLSYQLFIINLLINY